MTRVIGERIRAKTRTLKFYARIPRMTLVRLPVPTALIAAVAAAFGAAPAALADTSTSSNWAGYAVHRSGVHFTRVSAAWRQPKLTCAAPDQTYSAMWVGIGGYSQNSNALEQIGTEADCNSRGGTVSTAWYELVPAPSVPIHMTVRPGDVMSATVTLGAHRIVRVTLNDYTRHTTFTRRLHAASIDDTAAEWILEAPSACISATACQTLPLANFGTAAFGLAQARSSTGVTGTISNPAWDSTEILLAPHGRRFAAYSGGTQLAGGATPSLVAAAGSAFSVSYDRVMVNGNSFFATRRAAADRPTFLRH
jgi:hypothetical protein